VDERIDVFWTSIQRFEVQLATDMNLISEILRHAAATTWLEVTAARAVPRSLVRIRSWSGVTALVGIKASTVGPRSMLYLSVAVFCVGSFCALRQ
jgi:hypothetical protein